MTLKQLLELFRIDEEFTLLHSYSNQWLMSVTVKEYVPPRYLSWKVKQISTDMSFTSEPIIEIQISEE